MSKTATYALIETVTLGSAVSSVSFNVSGLGYTDLILQAVPSGSGSTSAGVFARFNGDTGSNYSDTSIFGNGSTATSSRNTNQTGAGISIMWSGVIGSSTTHILDYSNSTTFKTAISRRAQTSWGTDAVVSLWRNTNAITSILIYSSANLPAGSTFNLYGIQAGNA